MPLAASQQPAKTQRGAAGYSVHLARRMAANRILGLIRTTFFDGVHKFFFFFFFFFFIL